MKIRIRGRAAAVLTLAALAAGLLAAAPAQAAAVAHDGPYSYTAHVWPPARGYVQDLVTYSGRLCPGSAVRSAVLHLGTSPVPPLPSPRDKAVTGIVRSGRIVFRVLFSRGDDGWWGISMVTMACASGTSWVTWGYYPVIGVGGVLPGTGARCSPDGGRDR